MSSFSYEQVPYPDFSFPESHPDRLATVASLFGLQPKTPTSGAVLELGCASGTNLIPLAYSQPQLQFVGIDQSQSQIAQGRAAIKELALTNITLEVCDLRNFKDNRKFDYIICHGVFSWVSREVQDRIFKIIGTNLAENGIAYVGYNTLPGWSLRRTLREEILYHTSPVREPQQALAQAQQFLEFLGATVNPESPYGLFLRDELPRLQKLPPGYFFHEHLENVNDPIYFHEFIERAHAVKLRFVAEAQFQSMLLDDLSPEIQLQLKALSQGDILRMEQYLDFIRNRAFRMTLLCHEGVKLERRITFDCLSKFSIGSTFREKGEGQIFENPQGLVAKISDPVLNAALVVLQESSPSWMSFSELLERLSGVMQRPADNLRDQVAARLFEAFQKSVIELHTFPPAFTVKISEKPVASALARHQAQKSNYVTNCRHERVLLNEPNRELLCRLDGTRRVDELIKNREQAQKSLQYLAKLALLVG